MLYWNKKVFFRTGRGKSARERSFFCSGAIQAEDDDDDDNDDSNNNDDDNNNDDYEFYESDHDDNDSAGKIESSTLIYSIKFFFTTNYISVYWLVVIAFTAIILRLLESLENYTFKERSVLSV